MRKGWKSHAVPSRILQRPPLPFDALRCPALPCPPVPFHALQCPSMASSADSLAPPLPFDPSSAVTEAPMHVLASTYMKYKFGHMHLWVCMYMPKLP